MHTLTVTDTGTGTHTDTDTHTHAHTDTHAHIHAHSVWHQTLRKSNLSADALCKMYATRSNDFRGEGIITSFLLFVIGKGAHSFHFFGMAVQ